MSLIEDLDKLRHQRDAEIHTLHLTYVRTKRTLIRATSPSRLIRQHVGLSLGAAALLGLLIAPRPAPRQETSANPRPTRAGPLQWIKKIATHFYPGAAQFIPDQPAPESPPQNHDPSTPPANKSPHKHHLMRTLLTEAAALLLSKIDLQKVISMVTQYLAHAMPQTPPQNNEDETPHPNVSVSNTGTVHADNIEDFE